MEEIDYLEKYGATNWYTVSKEELVLNSFNKKFKLNKKINVLNVGVGAGFLSKKMQDLGYTVTSVDIDTKSINYCKKKNLNKLVLASITSLPFNSSVFDCIICLDVLEHLKNDNLGVKELSRVIKKDGFLFTSVPAGSKLTYHDKRLGHFRRYTKNKLSNLLSRNGFKGKLRFWNSILYPLFFIYRSLGINSKKHDLEASGKMNTLLKIILSLEKRIVLPYGLTLFASVKRV